MATESEHAGRGTWGAKLGVAAADMVGVADSWRAVVQIKATAGGCRAAECRRAWCREMQRRCREAGDRGSAASRRKGRYGRRSRGAPATPSQGRRRGKEPLGPWARRARH